MYDRIHEEVDAQLLNNLYKTHIYIIPLLVVIKMRPKTQSFVMPVMNFDELARGSGETKEKRHGELLPNSIRAIFCGPSNCGKTNALFTLITHPNGLRFENVYVYSKSLKQPKYKLLERLLNSVVGVGYFPFNEHEQVSTPSDARPNSIFIFDDVACEKQDNIRAFFSMGRHENIDCFYLCQTYAHIPKHLVRDNANFIVLFKQDDMNLRHVYNDHVNTDMSYVQFRKLCSECWGSNKHGFIVIEKDSDMNEGRYRKGFDCFVSSNHDEDK